MQSHQPWYNLSCQSPQPTVRLPSAAFDPFTGYFQTQLSDQLSDQLPLVASLCSDFAFRSGSCLQIRGATACIACTDACVLLLLVSWRVCMWANLHFRCDHDFAALKAMLLPVHYSISCSHCFSHSHVTFSRICIWPILSRRRRKHGVAAFVS